jgi:ABC-2 type transport system permease protein
LLDVEDQPYIAYRKGAIVMYTLREYIGEDRVNGALRRFQEKYRGAKPPYPTSRDLYAELRAVTPDSLHTLLEDLFETITVWTLRMERAVFDRTESGEYAVTIEFNARKSRADSLGSLREVPMDDLVEVGVFARGEGDGLGEPLYLKQHRIRSGKHTLRIVVPREPGRAGIDPFRKLIDREDDDNVYEVRKNLQGGSR